MISFSQTLKPNNEGFDLWAAMEMLGLGHWSSKGSLHDGGLQWGRRSNSESGGS